MFITDNIKVKMKKAAFILTLTITLFFIGQSVVCETQDCSFEEGDCGWRPYVSDFFPDVNVWQVASGQNPVRKGAPVTDSTGKAAGHYIITYVNSSEDEWFFRTIWTEIDTPPFNTTQRHCLMSLAVYAGENATERQDVQIGVKPSLDAELTLVEISAITLTQKWQKITVDIGHQPWPFHVALRNVIQSANAEPVAIAFDDLTFNQDCSAPEPSLTGCEPGQFTCANKVCIDKTFHCDGFDHCGDNSDEETCDGRFVVTFENPTLDAKYVKLLTPGRDNPQVGASWKIHHGTDWTTHTGPRFDHTWANTTGHYITFKQISVPEELTRIWLATIPFKPRQSGCQLRFHYLMNGLSIGSLNVYWRPLINGPRNLLWSKSGHQGFLWERAVIDLAASQKNQNFDILIEATMSYYSFSDIAIDDISASEECKMLSESDITPAGKFTCHVTWPNVLIDSRKVCNFANDCPDGEDERPEICTPNPTIFESPELKTTGWEDKSATGYGWKAIKGDEVHRIYPNCSGACPKFGAEGSKSYAAADASYSGKDDHQVARLTHKIPISATGSTCSVSFWYFVTENGTAGLGKLELQRVLPGKPDTTLWSAKAISRQSKWIHVFVNIGAQPSKHHLEFHAHPPPFTFWPAVAAVDNVQFHDCQERYAVAACKANEFRCGISETCIESRFLCDFGDDCNDGDVTRMIPSWDEDSQMCNSAYATRCAFDDKTCDTWMSAKGDFAWHVTRANDTEYQTPPFDHTGHRSENGILWLDSRPFKHEPGKVARYQTTRRIIVSPLITSDCRLRFWIYYNALGGNDLGSVSVGVRTSFNPLEEKILATFSANLGDSWMRQEIPLTKDIVGAGGPFDIFFLGTSGSTMIDGGIAIDDISFTPDCQFVETALPGQTLPQTTTPAPPCNGDSGQFQCANKEGCYSANQHCNFKADCSDGSDEQGCTKTKTNFDEGATNWGNWEGICQLNGMPCNFMDIGWKWAWSNKKTDNLYPPGDFSTPSKDGGYLIALGGPTKADHAILASKRFAVASPICKLKFAYWSYSATLPVETKLNIFLKDDVGNIRLIDSVTSSDKRVWIEKEVPLYTLTAFEVFFELVRDASHELRFAIDDINFASCSPNDASQNCRSRRDFSCKDGSRCLPPWKVCDFHKDCQDGSDEVNCIGSWSPGTCSFDGPDWQRSCLLDSPIPGDALKWGVAPIDTLTFSPLKDHTTKSAKGGVLFFNAFAGDSGISGIGTTATKLIFASNNFGFCYVSFFYYMYRAKQSQGTGSLQIRTVGATSNNSVLHSKFSFLSLQRGAASGDALNPWTYVNVAITRLEPYTVQLVGETDDNALSSILVDDLHFSESCRSGMDPDQRPTEDTCPENKFHCKPKSYCMPSEWVCNEWCDCPLLTPEGKTVCEDEKTCSMEASETSTVKPTVTTKPNFKTTGLLDTTPTTTKAAPPATTLAPEHDNDKAAVIGLSVAFAIVCVLAIGGILAAFHFRSKRQLPKTRLASDDDYVPEIEIRPPTTPKTKPAEEMPLEKVKQETVEAIQSTTSDDYYQNVAEIPAETFKQETTEEMQKEETNADEASDEASY